MINASRVNINALASIQYFAAVSKEQNLKRRQNFSVKTTAEVFKNEILGVETTELSWLQSSRENSDVFNIHLF